MTALFHRGPTPPRVQRAAGCWITDTDGNQYLDAASGALVVNVGHGDSRVTSAIQRQLAEVAYVHPTAFTSEPVEAYARALAERLPMKDPAIYPVSGGSEAVETAVKAARAYHLANGQPERSIIISRDRSYHGNTLGALDLSWRHSMRAPYLPWLGLAAQVPVVLEYRCPNPSHPHNCGQWHADALEVEIERLGPDHVAAFIAEPIGGAASGASVPPEGYWAAVREVCATYGVLVIADEVMTGFGRTGAWFASEHFGLEPDIITLAKGAASGYWPLGVCAMAGNVASALRDSGFVHGFTFSHHVVGAAAGLAVIQRIDGLGLVEASRRQGHALRRALEEGIGQHPVVGDIRGMGLLIGLELVADRESKRPFPREELMAEKVTRLARDRGLLVYPSTGSAGDGLGDVIMIGPPLIVTESEIEALVTRLADALDAVA